MTRISIFNFRFSILILVFCLPASAVSNAGSTGAAFLEFGVGARSGAMGEANAAWADDAYGMYFNPAGIARIRRKEIGLFHNTLFADLDYNYLGYIAPIGRSAAFGATVLYVDLGEVDRTTIASGIANTVIGRAGASDAMGSLTYARALTPKLDVGVTLKVVHEKLDRFAATAGALDLGVKWNEPLQGLTLGLSLSNLGTRLQFVRESEELPVTLRAGAAYRTASGRLGLATDLVLVSNQDIEAKLGGEFWIWPKHFAMRAGVNSAKDVGSAFTAGAAFHWNDIAVDYAYVPFGDLGNQNLISLTYQFGPDRIPVDWTERPAKAAVAAAQRPEGPLTIRRVMKPTDRPLPPPISRPEPVRPAPLTTPEEVDLQPRFGLWASPFYYQSGPARYDYLGEVMMEVLHNDWKKSNMRADDGASALYQIEGDYRVEGERLIINAHLRSGSNEITSFQATSAVDKPYLAWMKLMADVKAAIRTHPNF